jgi:mRNA-degrading endonuclease YafQ of YafQ-DinJ toxin-antitoxin module
VAKDNKNYYTLVWTDTFARTARKFLRLHPELAGLFKDILLLLESDPQSPRLHLHSLQGKHRGNQVIKLTYDYRIILILKIIEKEIVLLDVGSHDDVYYN